MQIRNTLKANTRMTLRKYVKKLFAEITRFVVILLTMYT